MYTIPNDTGGEDTVYIDLDLYHGMAAAIIEAKNELPHPRVATPQARQEAGQSKMRMLASLMVLGGTLVKKGQLARDDQDRILYTINHFWILALAEDWKEELDPVLSASYHQLKRKLMNRYEVYQFARALLGTEAVGDSEAWRRRVDRWAKRHELEPVGKRGRPEKSK